MRLDIIDSFNYFLQNTLTLWGGLFIYFFIRDSMVWTLFERKAVWDPIDWGLIIRKFGWDCIGWG